jgi:hypothetical protein
LIEPERVEAIPETRLCVEHAREILRFGGEFVVTSATENLGKTGSLKKNYGGITMEKSRNKSAEEKLRREFEQAQDRQADR